MILCFRSIDANYNKAVTVSMWLNLTHIYEDWSLLSIPIE
jgi:hypothetical protein